ncbi:hypothetical protein AB0A71_04910 [Kitasatospora aureofaciens]|uniref:hypothetical protein n=1 Tax=Kitasatospora aureofaciens TaxID=1894 RepID=UPI0033CF14A0
MAWPPSWPLSSARSLPTSCRAPLHPAGLWSRLPWRRPGGRRRDVSRVADAQGRGVVSDRFEARLLFAVMIHLAMLWPTIAPEVLMVVDVHDAARRRELVRRVAAALLD